MSRRPSTPTQMPFLLYLHPFVPQSRALALGWAVLGSGECREDGIRLSAREALTILKGK